MSESRKESSKYRSQDQPREGYERSGSSGAGRPPSSLSTIVPDDCSDNDVYEKLPRRPSQFDHHQQQTPTSVAPPYFTPSMTEEQQVQQQQSQRLQQSHEGIERARQTNLMISQFIKLTADPAMLPHFLSLDIKCGEDGVSGSMKMNPERRQCAYCREWFFDRHALQSHESALPLHCDECGMCFMDAIYHAERHQHTRCFVARCTAKERHHYGQWAADIKAHVRKDHRS